jgi:hypothetical protein
MGGPPSGLLAAYGSLFRQPGTKGFSGLLLGVWGASSALAGLGYGALKGRMLLHRRLAISVALFAVMRASTAQPETAP